MNDKFLTGEEFNKSIFFSFKSKIIDNKELIDLPTSHSLKEFCPKVAQQKYGTCYSYSSAYGGRTILYNVNNGLDNPNENIFSPGFLQKLIYNKKRKCRNRGASTHYACKLMRDKGVAKLIDYPNDCSKQTITQELLTKVINNRIQVRRIINPGDRVVDKTSNIKLSIFERKPVVITVYTKKTTMMKNTKSEFWKPTRNDISRANTKKAQHAMCLIGYDDNKYGGAYEIMNSYGEDWMNKGFFWVNYDDMNKFISTAIELFEINT